MIWHYLPKKKRKIASGFPPAHAWISIAIVACMRGIGFSACRACLCGTCAAHDPVCQVPRKSHSQKLFAHYVWSTSVCSQRIRFYGPLPCWNLRRLFLSEDATIVGKHFGTKCPWWWYFSTLKSCGTRLPASLFRNLFTTCQCGFVWNYSRTPLATNLFCMFLDENAKRLNLNLWWLLGSPKVSSKNRFEFRRQLEGRGALIVAKCWLQIASRFCPCFILQCCMRIDGYQEGWKSITMGKHGDKTVPPPCLQACLQGSCKKGSVVHLTRIDVLYVLMIVFEFVVADRKFMAFESFQHCCKCTFRAQPQESKGNKPHRHVGFTEVRLISRFNKFHYNLVSRVQSLVVMIMRMLLSNLEPPATNRKQPRAVKWTVWML